MRTILRYGLVLLVGAGLTSGCAGKDKWQEKMKGMWTLESRTLPDGTRITPPSISGSMEWFPMDVDARTAHVSVLTTYGNTDLQVHGSHYDLDDYTRFSQNSYLEVGGGINKTHDKSYESVRSTDTGTIEVDGAKITFKHDKGLVYLFKGSVLTIKHKDGTTDVLTK